MDLSDPLEFLDDKLLSVSNINMESGMNNKKGIMIKLDLPPNLLMHYCLFEINHILASFGQQLKTEVK